ncbi:putative polyvalent protein kinase domain-containing protein [Filimonas zeae]
MALEDMHDENVIAQGQLLFFIDTVFYIMGK